MKINIYKNQKEIEKTYEVENYDLMYGTVQAIFTVMDKGIPDLNDNEGMLNLLIENRTKLEDILLDVFSSEGMTPDELKRTKLIEVVYLFIDLFQYVQDSFKSKN